MDASLARVWIGPSFRGEGIGRLSAKYRYREARSKERYLKRDDAIKVSCMPLPGIIGRYCHIKFIESR